MVEEINVPTIKLPLLTSCFNPTDISFFKVNRAMCETCLKVTNKDTKTMTLMSLWCLYYSIWTEFTLYSGVSTVEFEQVNAGLETFVCV